LPAGGFCYLRQTKSSLIFKGGKRGRQALGSRKGGEASFCEGGDRKVYPLGQEKKNVIYSLREDREWGRRYLRRKIGEEVGLNTVNAP